MKVSLFTVTHRPDIEWLKYCRAAVAKFATGFQSWHIVSPCDGSQSSTLDTVDFPFPVIWHTSPCPAGLPGHNHQQVIKMRADVFANDADAVVYLDSDIIMHRKTAPEDFLENGKPIMEHCSTQHAVAHGVDPRWIRNAAKVIGRPAMVEAMRNSGIIHDTKVVRWCRESVERTTGMDIEEVFKHHWDINTGWFPDRATGVTKPGKPTLSEFITLGAFAWLACPERYSWRDVLQVGYRDIPLTRFWSHSGVTPQIEAQLNALLK